VNGSQDAGASDHYDQLRRDEREVQRAVADWPEIVEARRAPKPPTVRLLCPRRHLLFPVTMTDDADWGLRIAPARQDRPHRNRVHSTRVDPISLEQPGPRRDMTDGRTQLDCSKCSYSGVVRPARLLALYATALRLGRREIELESFSS
jgi:hypothetical protein